MIIFSGFFEPLFYLFSIGVGLGGLVGEVVGPGGNTVKYAAFVAPALLGSSAMNGAIYESTFNIFFKLKYGKIYDAVLATPMQPADIAVGEITWSLMRGAIYATGFLVVMAAMGYMPSWWGILALPAATLIGFAFGACGMAVTTFMRSWQDFDLVGLVTLPLFLFSGTFYPLSVYPRGLPGDHPLLPALPQRGDHPLPDPGHLRLEPGRARRLPAGDGGDRGDRRLPPPGEAAAEVGGRRPAASRPTR